MQKSEILQYNEIDGLFYTQDRQVATAQQVKEYHYKLFDFMEDIFDLK